MAATKNQKPPAPADYATNAEKILQWWSQTESGLMTWKTTWQQIGDYFCPRKSQINTERTEGSAVELVDLYNQTGIRAGQINANGFFDALLGGKFFSYVPPNDRLPTGDAARKWMERATEVTLDRLQASNFYLEAHEMFGDWSYFGTGNLLAEWQEGALLFANDKIGSYTISEGPNKVVDTVLRKYQLTVAQAVDEFGENKVGKSIRKLYNSGQMADRSKRFDFIQAIYPRAKKDINPKALDGTQFPIASCHVQMVDRVTCRDGGYEEMPCAVPRYLKWNKDPYGWAPSVIALPVARQLNFIEQAMDALADQKVNPRILAPTSMDGNDIDFRARGITFTSEQDPNGWPRVWMDEGEYQVGQERLDSKNKLMEQMFNVDMWQMLNTIEREMTAYEVQQRLAEKTSSISPAYHRIQPEFFNVILTRVFHLLLRAGEFGDIAAIPRELLEVTANGVRMKSPKVVLTGKLAMAIRAAENAATQQWVQMAAGLAGVVGPSAMDAVNIGKAMMSAARNMGVPVEVQNTEAEQRAIAKARSDAAQAAAQLQALQSGSQSVANLAKPGAAGVIKALTGGGVPS